MRIIILFIFAHLFFSIFVKGQQRDFNSLKLTIKVNKNQICLGKTIDLSAKLTNVSKDSIVIDTNQIGYRTDFSWFIYQPGRSQGGSFTSIGDDALGSAPNFIVLQPNESYTKNEPFVFDEKVLVKVRNFKMRIAYRQFSETNFENSVVWRGVIESNEIDIFIKKCRT